jgi:hypothetical protein
VLDCVGSELDRELVDAEMGSWRVVKVASIWDGGGGTFWGWVAVAGAWAALGLLDICN